MGWHSLPSVGGVLFVLIWAAYECLLCASCSLSVGPRKINKTRVLVGGDSTHEVPDGRRPMVGISFLFLPSWSSQSGKIDIEDGRQACR